ncbi:hypothetical protein AB7M17_004261 [Bradyrhizobium sp. USDA 377]
MTKGTDKFETTISNYRKDDEGRDEFAGMTHELVNEQTEGEPERKPKIVMYHHFVFVRAQMRKSTLQ